ncbi:MAG: MFS transporter [Candidatus Aenigmatarchaeota archaeon]
MKAKDEPKRAVKVFAAASFLNDMGSDMIYPIWPLFLATVLKANMAVIGFIDGLGDAIVSVSQAASGYVSDRTRKRKIFIWTGYLCGGVSRIGYALSRTWEHIVPFRVLDRAGKMRGAPRDAIIADVSTKKDRGRNFGVLRAMDNLGAVTGIVLTILLFGLLGYQNIFLLASIPSIIAVILIIFLIRERKAESHKIYKGVSFRDFDRNLWLFFLLSGIFALGSFSYSFLLIYAKEFGFDVGFIPVLYLIFTAVAFLFSIPFGKLSDRIGRKPVLMAAFGFWGLLCLTFILVQAYFAVVLVFVLYGLHRGALEPVQKTLVSELAPEKYRASTLGAFQMVVGLTALPASLIAGVMWDTMGLFVPLYFSLFLTVIAFLLMFFVREK